VRLSAGRTHRGPPLTFPARTLDARKSCIPIDIHVGGGINISHARGGDPGSHP